MYLGVTSVPSASLPPSTNVTTAHGESRQPGGRCVSSSRARAVELVGAGLLGVGAQDGGGLGSGGHRDPSSAAKAALMRFRKSINSR